MICVVPVQCGIVSVTSDLYSASCHNETEEDSDSDEGVHPRLLNLDW